MVKLLHYCNLSIKVSNYQYNFLLSVQKVALVQDKCSDKKAEESIEKAVGGNYLQRMHLNLM